MFQDVFHPPNGVETLRIAMRVLHILGGITWIGLLYFFNLVNVPLQKGLDPDTKKKVNPELLGRTLWFFRWGAVLTFLSGIGILGMRQASWNDSWGMTILTGAAFGIVMFLNVWLVIWPNQKVVIASAVAAASGGQANPKAGPAGRRAFLASRTNVVMSFPMLFFMGAASHFPLAATPNAGRFGLVLLAVLAALEINALTGTTGPTKKPIETVRGVIVTGFVTTAIVYALAQAVLGS